MFCQSLSAIFVCLPLTFISCGPVIATWERTGLHSAVSKSKWRPVCFGKTQSRWRTWNFGAEMKRRVQSKVLWDTPSVARIVRNVLAVIYIMFYFIFSKFHQTQTCIFACRALNTQHIAKLPCLRSMESTFCRSWRLAFFFAKSSRTRVVKTNGKLTY